MNERIAVLLVALLLEMLAGLGLRNEAMSARGRIEVQRRLEAKCEARLVYYEHLLHELSSPANMLAELERRKLAEEIANLPQL